MADVTMEKRCFYKTSIQWNLSIVVILRTLKKVAVIESDLLAQVETASNREMTY